MHIFSSSFVPLVATAIVFSVANAAGCGPDGGSQFPDVSTDSGSGPAFPGPSLSGPFNDFPKAPVIDGNAPANAPQLFVAATAAATGGPCLMEPEIGAMFPRNWLRPRFRWIGEGSLGADAGAGTSAAHNLFELRIHADNQVDDLVVYTTNAMWTMPKPMWDALRAHSAGQAMTMAIKGGILDGTTVRGVASGASGPLSIAPADAPGTIVYWTTTAGGLNDGGYNPVLKGFRVGDESVQDVLRPAQLQDTSAGPVKCVGCHSSTPDGVYAAVSTRPDDLGGGVTQVGLGSVDGTGAAPPYVSATAKALLGRSEQVLPTFSPAHFASGDRVAVTMYRSAVGFDIAWTDLETSSTAQGTGWGLFTRTGDVQHAALASLSHDGTKIVYISTPNASTSGTTVTEGKLFTVPYGNRQGGTVSEVAGANEAGHKVYYPSFAPDDSLIAYNRSTAGTSSYNDPQGEVFVIPASGGTPSRLAANDPPACSGAKSPGVYNSWPKWSPEVGAVGGKKYYFLVFSSARNSGAQRFGARLYVTPVVVEGTKITTYSALYLWNQPDTEDNHSPAWDSFKISNAPK